MTDTSSPQADPIGETPTETARALLYRHGLPEDVLDGALCLHAQELAALQRLRMDELDLTGQKARVVGRIVDLIDPTKTPATFAAAPVPAPAPTDQAARTERYAVAIHDAMESDLSLVDQEPAFQALFARAAEAAVTVADAEQAELRRQRDLAIAHDRQPYPTAWAYEQACKALRRKEAAIERALTFAASLDETVRSMVGPEAVHPVAERIRYLLNAQADEEQQPDAEAHTTWTPGPVAVGQAADWARQQPAAEATSCTHRGPHPGFTCAEVDQARPYWNVRWNQEQAEPPKPAPVEEHAAGTSTTCPVCKDQAPPRYPHICPGPDDAEERTS